MRTSLDIFEARFRRGATLTLREQNALLTEAQTLKRERDELKDANAEFRLRYFGLLGLLTECSPHLKDEELLQSIQDAMLDARDVNPNVRVKRVGRRLEIEFAKEEE